MDLIEGAYSTSQLPRDLAASPVVMDSECCPNPEQCEALSAQPAQPQPPIAHDIRSDFCTTFCG